MSKEKIVNGETSLGIEFGSTRIKAVLTDYSGAVLAIGTYDWENSLVDNIWTYSEEEILAGLKGCYSSLVSAVDSKYGVKITKIGAMGISAMMHGYLAFDKDGKLLAPFQTWRNSNTGKAADELTELFDFNIPLRWTISHLYQRILDGEKHVKDIAFVTTLDSFIHCLLTGEKITGIGDASGIFPIDSKTCDYDQTMVDKFDKLLDDKGYRKSLGFNWKLRDILPKVLVAGEKAGQLTEAGAALLDESGNLQAGAVFCPSEGDAGTGMVATNSVAPKTGNISAGTSTFAMIVLEKQLSKLHREIDMVTTPDGYPVAMSHANNGTSDLNSWVGLFAEFANLLMAKYSNEDIEELEKLDGAEAQSRVDIGDIYEILYKNSLKGDLDAGGLLSYGYLSGEGITGFNEGRPLFARRPDGYMNLANFMKSHLYTSLGAVKMGLDIILKEEGMACESINGHGGFFKTEGVGQRYLAAAVNAPVTVMANAGEGGPWGMALLGIYMLEKDNYASLSEFLEKKVFKDVAKTTVCPDAKEVEGFERFMDSYKKGLAIEKAAIESL